MKKVYIPLILIFIFVLFFILLNIDFSYSDVSHFINLKFTKKDVIFEKDTHGGFLGDGEKLYIFSCSEKKVKKVNNFKELPIDDDLHYLIYEEVHDMKLASMIPDVSDGMYLYFDKLNNTYNFKLKENNDPYNFIFILYDKKTNKLYYYELDT